MEYSKTSEPQGAENVGPPHPAGQGAQPHPVQGTQGLNQPPPGQGTQPPPGQGTQPPPGVSYPAPPVPTVYIIQEPPKPPTSRLHHYKATCAVIFGAAQIIITLLMLVVISLLFYYETKVTTYEYIAFPAIFAAIIGGIGGILFLVTGAINICSGKFKTKCLIVSTLVLCILSLVLFCTPWFGYYIYEVMFYSAEICEDGVCRLNTGTVNCLIVGLTMCVIFIVVTFASSCIVCMALCKGSAQVEDEQQKDGKPPIQGQVGVQGNPGSVQYGSIP